jgi:hypothetical protein
VNWNDHLEIFVSPVFGLKNPKPTKTDRKSAVYCRIRTASIQRVSVTRPMDVLGQLESHHPSYAMLLYRCNDFHGHSTIFQFPVIRASLSIGSSLLTSRLKVLNLSQRMVSMTIAQ